MAFYPKDYTYVCPTEIIAFSDRCKEFEEAGAQIVVASHDSCEVHGSWCNLARSKGGLGKITVPMIGDTKKVISAAYGCLHEESGLALRGLYIISPDGVLHHSTVSFFFFTFNFLILFFSSFCFASFRFVSFRFASFRSVSLHRHKREAE